MKSIANWWGSTCTLVKRLLWRTEAPRWHPHWAPGWQPTPTGQLCEWATLEVNPSTSFDPYQLMLQQVEKPFCRVLQKLQTCEQDCCHFKLLNFDIIHNAAIDNQSNDHGLNEIMQRKGGRYFKFPFTNLMYCHYFYYSLYILVINGCSCTLPLQMVC